MIGVCLRKILLVQSYQIKVLREDDVKLSQRLIRTLMGKGWMECSYSEQVEMLELTETTIDVGLATLPFFERSASLIVEPFKVENLAKKIKAGQIGLLVTVGSSSLCGVRNLGAVCKELVKHNAKLLILNEAVSSGSDDLFGPAEFLEVINRLANAHPPTWHRLITNPPKTELALSWALDQLELLDDRMEQTLALSTREISRRTLQSAFTMKLSLGNGVRRQQVINFGGPAEQSSYQATRAAQTVKKFHQDKLLHTITHDQFDRHVADKLKLHPNKRPPYSYTQLVTQVISSAQPPRLTVTQIAVQITHNYLYSAVKMTTQQREYALGQVVRSSKLNKGKFKLVPVPQKRGKGAQGGARQPCGSCPASPSPGTGGALPSGGQCM